MTSLGSPFCQPRPRRSRLVVVLLGLALAAGEARADDGSVVVHDLDPRTGAETVRRELSLTYLSVGPIFSLVGGPADTTGEGVEASLFHYPLPRIPGLGYGAFAQAQLYRGKYLRTALGVEGSAGPAGIELGLAVRQTDGTFATTLSVHGAIYLSIGYFSVAVRVCPVLVAFPGDEPSFGLETGLTFGLKLPIAVQGRDPTGYAIQAAKPGD